MGLDAFHPLVPKTFGRGKKGKKYTILIENIQPLIRITNRLYQLLEVKNAEACTNYGLNNFRFPQALKIEEKFQV